MDVGNIATWVCIPKEKQSILFVWGIQSAIERFAPDGVTWQFTPHPKYGTFCANFDVVENAKVHGKPHKFVFSEDAFVHFRMREILPPYDVDKIVVRMRERHMNHRVLIAIARVLMPYGDTYVTLTATGEPRLMTNDKVEGYEE